MGNVCGNFNDCSCFNLNMSNVIYNLELEHSYLYFYAVLEFVLNKNER